jgi:dihydrofolate reductase
MRISLIAAVATNRVIGHRNRLPWRLPADLQHFKRVTMGKPVVMGRKTWESIGRPLRGRVNIVISRDTALQAEGCVVVHSVEQALEAAAGADEIMIMGGAELYAQALPRADRLYLTEVRADVQGDVWFPDIDRGDWIEVSRERHCADEKNDHDYEFVVLDRR